MSFNIYTTDFFGKELKKLSQKYPSVKSDYKILVDSLKEKPTQGQPLGKDCYKIKSSRPASGRNISLDGYKGDRKREEEDRRPETGHKESTLNTLIFFMYFW